MVLPLTTPPATGHSDQECLKQKTNGNTGSANFTNIYSPHLSESPVNTTVPVKTTVATASGATVGYMVEYSVMASSAAKPAPQERDRRRHAKRNSAGRKRLDFPELWGAGGESMGLVAIAEKYGGNGILGDNEGSVKLLVDSRASEHYLEDRSGLREGLSEYVRLDEPREITTAWNHTLKGVATGILSGYIIDQTGVRQQVRLPVVVVPNNWRNLFSVPSALEQGATTIFVLEDSRIETNDFTILLQQVGGASRPLHVQTSRQGEWTWHCTRT